MSALVQAVDLVHELQSTEPPLLVDVRWSLDGPDRDAYTTGHLPGAVFCDLDAELSSPAGERGRHPLPSPEQMTRTMRRLGVGPGRDVVVYDGGSGLAAARAWWCLRWAGHDRVRVLDGGLVAWLASGGELTSGEVTPEPAPDARARTGALPAVSVDDVVSGSAGVLIDTRGVERFRGEHEQVDPVAGHIPGAVSLPISRMLADDGRLLPPDGLREVLSSLPEGTLPTPADGDDGAPAVTAYCGSGVTAAQAVLALREAGVDAALYPGSWSEWIADPARPVATGD